MSEIIRFEPNIPVQVAIRFADGRDVDGQYGPQKMFSTVDGKIFYLDLAVAERIAANGIQPRQPFKICKQKVGNRTEWQIEKITPPPPAPKPAAAPEASQLATPADANLMAACLMQSVDAAMFSEDYAAKKGYTVEFTSEDIRSMAVSLYIQHSKSGVSQWRQ